MTYKELITLECEKYAKNPKARFIGYNTVFGSRMYGTLNKVDKDQCIEMPVAENLMMGLAMGMSLEGYRPVVCFERHDFMLLAMDAMLNHLDKMPWMSEGQYQFPVLIRAIVGSSRPLNPGPQHVQNYGTLLMNSLKHTKVFFMANGTQVKDAFAGVGKSDSGAVVLVEYRDSYDEEIPEKGLDFCCGRGKLVSVPKTQSREKTPKKICKKICQQSH